MKRKRNKSQFNEPVYKHEERNLVSYITKVVFLNKELKRKAVVCLVEKFSFK